MRLLPLHTYLRLLALGVRLNLRRVARPRRLRDLIAPPRDDVALCLGDGMTWLAAATWEIDVMTFWEIFVLRIYAGAYAGTVVLDLGGHRGYFGAFAMLRRARHVYSFEPQRDNYATLLRTLRTFEGARGRWTAEASAIGETDGEVDLYVSSESWSHSIYKPRDGEVVGRQRVPMRRLAPILEAMQTRYPRSPLIVKINIEGAAGDVILSTPVSLWRGVAEVMFDFEATTPQRLEDVTTHLRHAGFVRAAPPRHGVQRWRQIAPPAR